MFLLKLLAVSRKKFMREAFRRRRRWVMGKTDRKSTAGDVSMKDGLKWNYFDCFFHIEPIHNVVRQMFMNLRLLWNIHEIPHILIHAMSAEQNLHFTRSLATLTGFRAREIKKKIPEFSILKIQFEIVQKTRSARRRSSRSSRTFAVYRRSWRDI